MNDHLREREMRPTTGSIPIVEGGGAGARPEKALLYRLVGRELRRGTGQGTVLDLACGNMWMAKSFPGRRYIGVDIMKDHIANGLRDNPGATGICSSIEALPADVSGDFVLCLQCLGMNRFFDPANTMACVRRMVEATAPQGRLLFNVGQLSRSYFPEIEALLTKHFGHVRTHAYGRFEAHRPPVVAWVLSRLMYLFPPLAKEEVRAPRRLYVCADRR